jgi:zinc/manganese transport system substrate-binding protein
MTHALSNLDQEHASFYKTNLAAFEAKLREKHKQWASVSLKGKRFVAYHRFFEYLAQEFGFHIIGYVEEKPGIPPSAGYIEKLVEDMRRSKPDGVITTAYYGQDEINALSKRTGVKSIVIPHDVGAAPGINDWFSLMDTVLKLLQ